MGSGAIPLSPWQCMSILTILSVNLELKRWQRSRDIRKWEAGRRVPAPRTKARPGRDAAQFRARMNP
jgi:hypothetical protein